MKATISRAAPWRSTHLSMLPLYVLVGAASLAFAVLSGGALGAWPLLMLPACSLLHVMLARYERAVAADRLLPARQRMSE